jgi:hypothetical protein
VAVTAEEEAVVVGPEALEVAAGSAALVVEARDQRHPSRTQPEIHSPTTIAICDSVYRSALQSRLHLPRVKIMVRCRYEAGWRSTMICRRSRQRATM